MYKKATQSYLTIVSRKRIHHLHRYRFFFWFKQFLFSWMSFRISSRVFIPPPPKKKRRPSGGFFFGVKHLVENFPLDTDGYFFSRIFWGRGGGQNSGWLSISFLLSTFTVTCMNMGFPACWTFILPSDGSLARGSAKRHVTDRNVAVSDYFDSNYFWIIVIVFAFLFGVLIPV